MGVQTRELADLPHSAESVPCLSLADLISEYDLGWIDLLKVDIEGAEKEVFSSPSEWIGSVGAIAIELHDRFKTGCARSFYAAVSDFPVEQTMGENVSWHAERGGVATSGRGDGGSRRQRVETGLGEQEALVELARLGHR